VTIGPAGEAGRDAAPRPDAGRRYRPVRLHRTGGLGRVWLAYDTVIGRDVALKELRPDRVDDGPWGTRFLDEARVTGQLEHPSIVPLYDLLPGAPGPASVEESSSPGPCYVMRFVSGRTLSEAVEDYHRRRTAGTSTPLELAGLLDAFVAVCRAVAYAHSRHVLHRDLKGQNIILGEFGEVLVLDWGLAKVTAGPDAGGAAPIPASGPRDETQPGAILGTPAYMAPELADGELASRATDVYALGAVLYAILTGQALYDGHSALDVLSKVRATPPARPRAVNPGAPPALEAVCRKAMARDSAARYASADELAAEVRRWMADEPVHAYRESWVAGAARWARRHRTAVVGAAALLVSAVVGLSVGAALIWREEQRTAEQKRAAEREWSRAEKNLDLARSLGPQLLDVVDQRLSRVARTEAIRKEIIAAAVQKVRDALGQQPDDPELRYWTARLQRYSANLHRQLNQLDAAGRLYDEAVAMLGGLAAQAPDVPFYRDQLAETLRDQAQLLNRLGRLRDARAAADRSVGIAEQLVAESPGRADYRRTLAIGRIDRSGIRLALGEAVASEADARAAVETYRGLTRERAEGLDGLMMVLALNRLAVGLRELGRADEALPVHAEAVERAAALRKQSPTNNNYEHFHGRSLVEQGRTLARVPERRQDAEASLSTPLPSWDHLQERYPQTPQYREWPALARLERGQVRAAAGCPRPAAEDFEQARVGFEALANSAPDVTNYRAGLGRTYAALGRLALAGGDNATAVDWLTKARQALDEVVRRVPEDAQERQTLRDAEADLAKARGGR
jgi:tetratricopeptide (TPR) repeat protein/tRNA A-37 threonylcarbamoyl transferase component Bud32